MSKFFIFFTIAFNLLALSCAVPAENDPKLNPKSDTQSSPKSNVDTKREKFAASLSDQENARTHFSSKPSLFGGHKLPFFGIGQPSHQPMVRPQIFSQLAQLPILKPLLKPFQSPAPVAPVAPVYAPVSAPVKPFLPFFTQPAIPAISKPYPPVLSSKPTFVVSQQVIHKPLVTEKIEIIRRPVYSEVVEVVHKPILSEVQQVIKHPTYVEHVVKKPMVTAIKNEFQGSPVHLPSQQYEVHDKPQHVQPVTTEVVQIPHQQVPLGSGYGSSYGYGVSSPVVSSSPILGSGYGSSYGLGSGYGSSYYGSGSGYGSSYGLGSGYGSSYGSGSGSSYGSGSGYGSSYGLGSGYGSSYGSGYGYGPSYGSGSSYGSSYGSGSGYGSSYGPQSGYGSSYGTGSGYGSSYGSGSGYGSSYGVKPTYGEESGGVEHTYVEPAQICKSADDCKPIIVDDQLNENFLPVNPAPLLWYNGQSYHDGRQLYRQASAEEYDQGLPLPANYLYMAPQMQPEEQMMEEQQDSRIAEFLQNPSARPELEALMDKYRKTDTNARPDDRKLPNTSRSNVNDDDDVRLSANEQSNKNDMMMSVDDKVEQVIDTLKTANESMLKKIEVKVKDRQHELENMPVSSTDGTTANMS